MVCSLWWQEELLSLEPVSGCHIDVTEHAPGRDMHSLASGSPWKLRVSALSLGDRQQDTASLRGFQLTSRSLGSHGDLSRMTALCGPTLQVLNPDLSLVGPWHWGFQKALQVMGSQV